MGSRFWTILLAEIRLMLKRQKWWWYAVALGLFIAILVVRSREGPLYLLFSVSWLWPILLWSALGNRENRNQTCQIIFSAAHMLRRQLPAMWLAGVMVAMMTGAGYALRMMFAGQWNQLVAWIIGALFVPSLALVLGVWTGSGRLFEVVYVVIWYLGLSKGVRIFDYKGMYSESVEGGVPLFYLLIVIVLLIFAVIGRWRQIHG